MSVNLVKFYHFPPPTFISVKGGGAIILQQDNINFFFYVNLYDLLIKYLDDYKIKLLMYKLKTPTVIALNRSRFIFMKVSLQLGIERIT